MSNRDPQADAVLVEEIRNAITGLPTYCCRSVTKQINIAREQQGLDAVNHKRIYRVMKAYNMLRSRGGKNGVTGEFAHPDCP